MTYTLKSEHLRAINSMTKYPSIPTYHALDPKDGGLLEEPTIFPSDVLVTEKIDGANARIIFTPDDRYLLGSREELLYAMGDIVSNQSLGLVEQLKPVAEEIVEKFWGSDLAVIFLELFGGKGVGSSRRYTKDPAIFGWRILDYATIDVDEFVDMLDWPSERIAGWRERGGQPWADEEWLAGVSEITDIALAPRLASIPPEDLPVTVAETSEWLARWPSTNVHLDGQTDKAEGVVLRTADRSVITKARFQDYERTLRRRGRIGR